MLKYNKVKWIKLNFLPPDFQFFDLLDLVYYLDCCGRMRLVWKLHDSQTKLLRSIDKTLPYRGNPIDPILSNPNNLHLCKHFLIFRGPALGMKCAKRSSEKSFDVDVPRTTFADPPADTTMRSVQ